MVSFTNISNSDITNLKISDGAFRCYLFLQSICYGDKDSCYPSIKYIAVALGRSCRTINRYIKELVLNGLIIKRRRGSTSNLYTLVKKKMAVGLENLKKVKENIEKKYNKNLSNKYEKKIDTFNNYDQRNYDCNKLESLLLYGKGKLSDCIKK